jgi:hypothetical protein
MGWTVTGSSTKKAKRKNWRYRLFRWEQAIWSFGTTIAWVGIATYRVGYLHELQFVPLLLSGFFVTYVTGRVMLYHEERLQAKETYSRDTGAPTAITPPRQYSPQLNELGKTFRVPSSTHVSEMPTMPIPARRQQPQQRRWRQ